MKKYLSLLLAIILVTATSVGTVFADSNLEGMPDSLKNIVKDNYWAELEYKSKNAIPKYLMNLITRVQESVQIDSVYFQCYHEKIISIIQRCGHRFTLHWRKTLLKQMGNLR